VQGFFYRLFCIAIGDTTLRERVGIPLTGLTQPLILDYPKNPNINLHMSWSILCSKMVWGKRWLFS